VHQQFGGANVVTFHDPQINVLLLCSSVFICISAKGEGSLHGLYLSGQDKILFTDGKGIGVRRDYNGVLLLDTILQTPISKPDDVVKLELLLSEVICLYEVKLYL
jgi:baculoviral IAP repeat-containing protein 6